MIINYPTGSYASVIVSDPASPSNVTFTVSNGPPPRSRLAFIKIPVGTASSQRPPKSYTRTQRRAAVSQLASSSTRVGPRVTGSGMKQYEPGQTIDFDVVQSPIAIEPMLVGKSSETRHDVNLFDLGSLGIDVSTQEVIDQAAAAAYDSTINEMGVAIAARSTAESDIQSIQRSLSEVTKAIDALVVVIAINSSSQLTMALEELNKKKITLSDALAVSIDAASSAAILASTLKAKVDAIAPLVR